VRAAAQLRLRTLRTCYSLLLVHGNNSYIRAPQRYVKKFTACLVITETEWVYCAVQTGSLCIVQINVGI
jgi:hypothetical protein